MVEPVNRAGLWGLLVVERRIALLPAVAGPPPVPRRGGRRAGRRPHGGRPRPVRRPDAACGRCGASSSSAPCASPAGVRRSRRRVVSGLLALVGGGEWSEGCTFDAAADRRSSGASEVAVLPDGIGLRAPGPPRRAGRALVRRRSRSRSRPVGVLTRRDAFDADLAATLRGGQVHLPGRDLGHAPPIGAEGHAGARRHPRRPGRTAPRWPARTPAPTCCAIRWSTPGVGRSRSGSAWSASLAVIPQFDLWSPDKVRRTVELAPAGVSLVGVPRRTALLRHPDGSWTAAGRRSGRRLPRWPRGEPGRPRGVIGPRLAFRPPTRLNLGLAASSSGDRRHGEAFPLKSAVVPVRTNIRGA